MGVAASNRGARVIAREGETQIAEASARMDRASYEAQIEELRARLTAAEEACARAQTATLRVCVRARRMRAEAQRRAQTDQARHKIMSNLLARHWPGWTQNGEG